MVLANSLDLIPKILKQQNKTINSVLKKIGSDFTNTSSIVRTITDILDKNAPHQIKKGNVIADGIDTELDELRDLATGGKKWIKQFQENPWFLFKSIPCPAM